MNHLIPTCLLVVVLLCGYFTPIRSAETDQGKQLYMQYCGSCHGKDGRGNGSVAAYLKIKVPDLTVLKKDNKSIYPLQKVMSSIDGSRDFGGMGTGRCRFGARYSEKKLRKRSIPS